jgi:hypothetical protein
MYFPNKIGHFSEGWPLVGAESSTPAKIGSYLRRAESQVGRQRGVANHRRGPLFRSGNPNLRFTHPTKPWLHLSPILWNPIRELWVGMHGKV